MLRSQNSEVFCVIAVPPFRPSLRGSLNNCQTSRGLTVCVLTKKKKKGFIATIECGKIRQKPRYTVNEVPLTKNSLRAPYFVARNNSLLRLHWRPHSVGVRNKTKTQGKSLLFLFLSIRTYFVHFHTFSYIFKVRRTPTEFGPPVKPQGDCFFC